jgi:predicted TIM-barrel fold metal-dependent hydrolase
VNHISEKGFRRIAVEEAFMIPEQLDAIRRRIESGIDDPDLDMWRVLIGDPRQVLVSRLLDVAEERRRWMDDLDVDLFILSLTTPGPQMFNADEGAGLASLANDRLAEIIAADPSRYAGLASLAPQDPAGAVREMERAIRDLKLCGVIVNSHTHGEYLDEVKYWPILEAAESLDVAIYIHPRAPSPAMAGPFRIYNMDNALWGYQADTGLHAMRMISSGLFDRFPKLKIVLGHLGEGIPFWLWRIDYMHRQNPARPKLKKKPSEYFLDNFTVTTSGMNWMPTLDFCLSVLGPDRIMFAIDYPYQRPAIAVKFLDDAPIAEDVKRKIYQDNAERVFRLAKSENAH